MQNITGIGLYIQTKEDRQQMNIIILSTEERVCSPLQAKALALQVAAQVVIALKEEAIAFYADNQTWLRMHSLEIFEIIMGIGKLGVT